MPICIYCEKENPDSEMTLEHVIPRSLGGQFAPDKFKVRRVCKRCNSNLGQFVDALFEKSWFVSGWLGMSARDCCDPDNPVPIPPFCLGPSKISLPGMLEHEVCEHYVGPFGESIILVRHNDDKFYSYNGGNPRLKKEDNVRAYFLVTEKTNKNQKIAFYFLRNFFSNWKVKKILCAEISGASYTDLGFSDMDDIDVLRYRFIKDNSIFKGDVHIELGVNINFDLRFISKIARGIGFSLFGNSVFNGAYSQEIFKSIWHRGEDDSPKVFGSGFFTTQVSPSLNSLFHKQAITILLMPINGGVGLNLSIGGERGVSILLADSTMVDKEGLDYISYGQAIVLFKFMKIAFVMPIMDYVAHQSGVVINPALGEVEEKIRSNQAKWEKLVGPAGLEPATRPL